MEKHLPPSSSPKSSLPQSSLSKSSAGHEVSDAGVRPIVLVGAGLASTLAVVGLVVYGLFQYLSAHGSTSPQSNPMTVFDSQIPPVPHIEEHPAIEIQTLRAEEDRTLSTYGWVDKKTGVVRIPIDRAMELQLQQGFPVSKEAAKK
jgi:hypothetical protein